jgi:hypothetical protein
MTDIVIAVEDAQGDQYEIVVDGPTLWAEWHELCCTMFEAIAMIYALRVRVPDDHDVTADEINRLIGILMSGDFGGDAA